MSVTVAPLDAVQHAAYVASQPSVSYLHTPEWFATKAPGTATALGFFTDGELVGVGVAQYLGRFAGRKSAYFPDGPHVEWDRVNPATALAALAGWLRREGCYEVRMGPFVVWHTWSNDVLKEALSREANTDLESLPATTTDECLTGVVRALEAGGWTVAPESDTNDAQNSYNVFVDTDRPAEAILAGTNQMFRRNVKKAQKAGVVVRQGGAADLPTFHALYRSSGEREDFYVQPLEYFTTQFAAFGDDRARVRVFIAEIDGEPLAGAVWLKVGDHVWYTRGGSSESHRELRAVNILQWEMMRAAQEAGAKVYDMGGIYRTIDARTRGLLQFKVATGGYAVGSMREWRLSLDPWRVRGSRALVSGRRRLKKLLRP